MVLAEAGVGLRPSEAQKKIKKMKNIKNWSEASQNNKQDEEIKKVQQRVTVLEEAENCLPLMEGVDICSNPKPGYKNGSCDFSHSGTVRRRNEARSSGTFASPSKNKTCPRCLRLDPSTLPFTIPPYAWRRTTQMVEDLSFGFYYDNLKECSVDKIKTLKDAAVARR